MDKASREYEGYSGQIAIEDDTLVLSRRGMAAKVTGLSGDPRRIPLAAVSDVALTPATRMTAGSIRLGLGGAPAPKATDLTNQNAVQFRHKANNSFNELFEFLLHVVQVNRDQGIDPSSVEYDQGKASATERMQEVADAAKDKRQEAKTNRQEAKTKPHEAWAETKQDFQARQQEIRAEWEETKASGKAQRQEIKAKYEEDKARHDAQRQEAKAKYEEEKAHRKAEQQDNIARLKQDWEALSQVRKGRPEEGAKERPIARALGFTLYSNTIQKTRGKDSGEHVLLGVTAQVETAEELQRRVTATRMLAVGMFAFAFKKKSGGTSYLTIEGPGFAWVEEVDRKKKAEAVKFAARVRGAVAALPPPALTTAPVADAEPSPALDVTDQIRKLGNLHDAGILTDEEFATKKADLLQRL